MVSITCDCGNVVLHVYFESLVILVWIVTPEHSLLDS